MPSCNHRQMPDALQRNYCWQPLPLGRGGHCHGEQLHCTGSRSGKDELSFDACIHSDELHKPPSHPRVLNKRVNALGC